MAERPLKVLVFTSGRQDWNALEPVVLRLSASHCFTVILVAGGTHCRSAPLPERLGVVKVDDWVDSLQASDTAMAVAQTAGWTTALMAPCLQRWRPDALVLVGDRTETAAVALAAVCMKVPVVHLHGGEDTQWAIDNLCRHAISKLASVHFVALPEHAERLLRMGESPDRVFTVGAPGLDQLSLRPAASADELAAHIGVSSIGAPLVALTYHPTTLGDQPADHEVGILLDAVAELIASLPSARVVITMANADEGGNRINDVIQAFRTRHPDAAIVVPALGEWYISLLRHADLMVGNSSSGLIEAATFRLPVVDVGHRQQGRARGRNVVHVDLDRGEILAAMTRCLDPGFREGLAGLVNPYGDGRASLRIAETLERLAPDIGPRMLHKRFSYHDRPNP